MTSRISEPARDAVNAPVYQVITETTDAGHGTSSTYTMSVGDTFSGVIGYAGDYDAVRIYLTAGHSYQFNVNGITLGDSWLQVFNPSGTIVATNDDYNWLDSQITYTVSTSGYYYIEASEASDSLTGSYQMTAIEVATPSVPADGTINQLVDYLVNGYWEAGGEQARSFDTSVSNVITVDLHNLTTAGQTLARWALQAWSAVANVTFQETTGAADIEFDDLPDATGSAYTSSDTTGTTINSSSVNVGTDWLSDYGKSMDSYSFQTYIHEIGHALGLGHQSYYNGTADFPTDADWGNDSWQLSIMSYFDQEQNWTTGASFAHDMTAMMVDIVAIQSMYGASTRSSGNTIYGKNSNAGGYLETLFDSMVAGSSSTYTGSAVAITIWDSGGRDTIDYSFSNVAQSLSLVAGTFSDMLGLVGNLAIAIGAVIENGITGGGKDKIVGNAVANNLQSGAGNDTLQGAAGNDTLDGGAGADSLRGDAGADSLIGGNGNDLLIGGIGVDRLVGGAGQDAFLFNAAATAGNADVITDFVVVDDTIRLDRSFFTGIASTGTLAASAFTSNTTGLAADASDRIIYETDTGKVWYDVDGQGGATRVLVATLDDHLAMTNADFLVIA
ncbi:serralysin [Rhodobacter viridis]|uniref:Serralysin n=1 Tax=Rhodobacter viridis TaxID=1054202 RepID=A0A318U2U4_9RHOB|nr:M10 family metallopeptidase C-terminal domain-containing protein [Rhodobacter viridis]PYF11821.1 serralysin [Rhodobacter viridis]